MKRPPVFGILAVLACAAAILAGCRRAHPDAPASTQAAGREYPVRGRVTAVDVAHGQVTIDGEAIPGFMDAMTMPYPIRDENVLKELHPGDAVNATLFVTAGGDYLDRIVVTEQAKPDYKPAVVYQQLTPGMAVPDFRLLNQSGRQIRLAQFRGKVLLVTFIYTRCPLADFCPRMSRNFAQVDKALARDPALYAKTHLLSVSFDPDYDTPAVLRSYGGAYTGRYTQETFAHWDFAAPSKKDLPDVTKFFVIGVTPEKDKTITHSLSTVVIGPDGKIAQWYPTNDWTPEQVLDDVRQVAAGKSVKQNMGGE